MCEETDDEEPDDMPRPKRLRRVVKPSGRVLHPAQSAGRPSLSARPFTPRDLRLRSGARLRLRPAVWCISTCGIAINSGAATNLTPPSDALTIAIAARPADAAETSNSNM